MGDELLHLLGDPAHWIFEGVADFTYGAIAVLVGRVPFRRWLARHDREKHDA